MIQIHSIQNHLSLSNKSRPDLNNFLKTENSGICQYIFIEIQVIMRIKIESENTGSMIPKNEIFETEFVKLHSFLINC